MAGGKLLQSLVGTSKPRRGVHPGDGGADHRSSLDDGGVVGFPGTACGTTYLARAETSVATAGRACSLTTVQWGATGERLARDLPLREGFTQAEGMGRAFVRRGQRPARDEEVPTAETREGEHRSFADRLGPKRRAAARLLGGRSPKKLAQVAALRRLATTIHEIGSRTSRSIVRAALAANEGIFQQPGKLGRVGPIKGVWRRVVQGGLGIRGRRRARPPRCRPR